MLTRTLQLIAVLARSENVSELRDQCN